MYKKIDQGKEKSWIAIVGDAFSQLLKTAKDNQEKQIILDLLTKNGKICARMSPENKTQLVCLLQDTGVLVGMCGDGANDCGALKQADIGISLSQADASVAAPFTSRIEHIGCTSTVLREGRCALVTSFQCFRFMALYGMIQFTTVVCLYIITSGLSDYQFLWIDLPHIIPLAIAMGHQGPYKHLTVEEPTGALISIPILSSIIGQVLISLLAQAIVLYVITPSFDGFDSLNPSNEDYIENYECYENTVLFVFSLLVYLNVTLAFTEGKPFRHTTLRNWRFMITFIALFLMDFYILFFPMDWTRDVLKLKEIPYDWKGYIFLAGFVHLFVAAMFESKGIPLLEKCLRRCCRKF